MSDQELCMLGRCMYVMRLLLQLHYQGGLQENKADLIFTDAVTSHLEILALMV